MDETAIGDDIDDYIDKSDMENLLSTEEVDGKIQGIEERRDQRRDMKNSWFKKLKLRRATRNVSGQGRFLRIGAIR